MNKNIKISTVAGVILYGLAALFSISLLLVLFDFGGVNPAAGTALYRFGKIFTGVYGLCSALIPVFLLTAAFECFTKKWHTRNGVILAGSVIPFFTLDALEHICRLFAAQDSGDVFIMKAGTAILTGLIIVAVEYLVLSMIGDAVENAGKIPSKAELKAAQEEALKKEAEDILREAVEEDAERISEKKNKLKELRQRLAETTKKFTLSEADDGEEDAEIGESEIPQTASIADDEDNPFAHVFDEDEDEKVEAGNSAENAEKVNEADDEDSVEVAEESENHPFDESFDEPEVNEEIVNASAIDNLAQQSVMDDQMEAEAIMNDYADAPQNDAFYEEEIIEESPFDDFDFPTEVQVVEEKIEEDNLDSYYDGEESLEDVKNYFKDDERSEVIEADDDIFGEVEIEEKALKDAEILDSTEQAAEAGIIEAETINEYESFDEPVLDNEEVSLPAVENDIEKYAVKKTEDEFESADAFGDQTFSSELLDGEDEMKNFVDARNSSFKSIFAQMDNDAAAEPAENFDSQIDEDFDSIFNDAAIEEGIDVELEEDPSVKDEYEFDPTAAPVVDANGMPFGPAVPFDMADNSYEEVTSVKKSGKPLSFAEKAVFLNDDEKNVESSALNAKPVSKKTAVDSNGNPVVDLEKIEKRKPKLKLANYKIPVEGILQTYENGEYWIIDDVTKKKAADLKQTLSEFNIEVEITGIRKGPVVTMFEVLPAPGVNVNKIRSLQDNIALRLAATSVRIVSPIPGKSAVGIEIPNASRAIVSFREIMEKKNPAFEKMNIPVILGKDISGEPQIIDLAKTPHLLIAGSTGAGKSVCVNSLILSILYKRNPEQVKLILVDPKVVELKLYNNIPHLLTPVITEPKKALQSLQYCICEMERRYALLDNMGVRDISSYNRRIEERHLMQEKLPYIVVIIDEFADLMATTGKELESNVARLAAMSRAVGIHLVLATQRPSVNVITGLIKANIPSRIAFMVASRTDSNIIIDQIGAEKLLGKGDMLYASATDPFPVRIQGTLVSDDEVEKVVEYVKQYGEPDYIDDEIFVDDEDEDGDGNPGLFGDGSDPLYDQALEIVVQSGKASASYLQRRLKIGYNRAARLVEEMEERGIVGPQNGSKPREVIYVP